ncbi:MAG: segregation/condensation protein A [Bdellovibrionales bacterium]|nr:segregation/condensation protein A [Bdellovibrionales bacterium]
MSIDIHLPYFDGPLPLLLYLIRKEEMNIFDIDIHKITSQYFDYIRRMKELDLETAGDFVAMAATLIQIKSQMLLPQYTEEGELLETEDPRKELVNRLLEYQKFQEVSKELYKRPLLGRDLFNRGAPESFADDGDETEILLDEGGLFSLISFYRRAIKNIKNKVHRVANKTKSIAARILEIKDRFVVGKTITLNSLIQSADDKRNELLITFLSLLELGKMGMVSLFQSDVYTDIHVTSKTEIATHHVDQVQEYDSQGSEQVADSLFEVNDLDHVHVDKINIGEELEQVASDEDIAQAERNLIVDDQEMKETENV